ncbi:MAG: 2-C-methyl-D-erythritol 4-phosphate cytidylyltransferase [Lachnospiraceae bacterium]|jgi:2-C-methyl-D-erythritol 4-phosphate cytidylyltransferase|nr:2-C-methyl-D-erythritol 4-phosphate cytidylyltransferase [Lachnospiraceae bacterium]MCI9470544.1 2-C-methyl-D-erythritol 4-phosphate cytidylyltransferase [Lachnospiraceae bacterium]
MNVAVIFSGGTGQRMNTKTKPKQFLELHGKPILVYTLELFQQSEKIDAIVLVMLKSWIGYTEELIDKYRLNKVSAIVEGGITGQESIYNGIIKAYELYPDDSVVLIHDGVRPLVDVETIEKCIACVEENGSAITVSPAIETIVLIEAREMIGRILPRQKCQMAKAPQCFILGDIYDAHKKAQKERKVDFIDSASLMQYYGAKLKTVVGTSENIKITSPGDFYIFRAISDARENSQIFGL